MTCDLSTSKLNGKPNAEEDVVVIKVPRSALLFIAKLMVPMLEESRTASAVSVLEPVIYGSRPPHAPPPGRSHRWMRDHGPALVEFGAMRRGGERGRGVFWTITSEGWARYVASTTPPALVPEKPVVIDPEGWLAKSGLRLTRRSNG